jgi:hypothetical protein
MEKSAMEDNNQETLKSQTVAEIDAPGEKNIAQTVAEDAAEKEPRKETLKTA